MLRGLPRCFPTICLTKSISNLVVWPTVGSALVFSKLNVNGVSKQNAYFEIGRVGQQH